MVLQLVAIIIIFYRQGNRSPELLRNWAEAAVSDGAEI
jgi:hypothetical protein